MRDRIPGEPGFLPGTVWTRAGAVRLGDRVFVRHNDEDLWALVIAINPVGDPAKVRLKLMLEVEGIPVGTCTHRPTKSTVYLRHAKALSSELRACPGDAPVGPPDEIST